MRKRQTRETRRHKGRLGTFTPPELGWTATRRALRIGLSAQSRAGPQARRLTWESHIFGEWVFERTNPWRLSCFGRPRQKAPELAHATWATCITSALALRRMPSRRGAGLRWGQNLRIHVPSTTWR